MTGNQQVFITGVSSGIGNGLAHAYLQQGWSVYGISRRQPHDLLERTGFHHCQADLSELDSISDALAPLLSGVPRLQLGIMNAGVLGQFGDMKEIGVSALRETMDVNLWANKCILDYLLAADFPVNQIVTISSGASVNGHRGWAGYAISKAALNMMTLLYAVENPATHFCALAPGIVDSEIQEQIFARPQDPRFPSIENLKSKRYTDEMPPAKVAGHRLLQIIDRLPTLVESGQYADIRRPPISHA